ncbi:MAG: insulinase family protein [Pseudomonadota bacterium]
MRRFWAACGLAGLMFWLAPGSRPALADPLQHPDLVSGELSNGLAYAILPASAADGVSFRLLVRVGSQAETEADRGIAHFVEHMAFRTTAHFADGEADRTLAQAGAGFGRDHNAFTSRWATTYHLDLPGADPAATATGLTWLRDVADGIAFRPAEVAAERGVILAELRDRMRSGDTTEEREIGFHYRPEDSLSPGGEAASLSALTPADLRAFHAKWYRPDRSLIVVAGAVDPPAMIAELERRLGGWAGAGERPRMPAPPEPEPPQTVSALILDPVRLPASSLACRNTPHAGRAEDDQDADAEDLRLTVLMDLLDTRLARAAATTPGVYALWFEDMAWYDTRRVACVRASHGPGQGLAALGLAQGVLRRFAADGPDLAEIDRAVSRQRAIARGALTERASATAAELADEIVYGAAAGRTFLHPHQRMRQISQGASRLTPMALRDAFRALWPENVPATLSVEGVDLARQKVIAAWRAGETAPPPPALPAPQPLAYDFGPEGKVVRREALAAGATRLTFASGLVLKHLPTDLSPGLVEIRILMGPGARRLSPPDYVAAGLGAAVLPTGGAGGLSHGDLAELNATWDWAFDADLTDSGLLVSARSFAGQTGPHLALILAHFMDPGFDVEVGDRMLLAAAGLEQAQRLEPAQAAQTAFVHTLWPETSGAVNDPETYRRLTPDDLRTALAPLLQTGPIELTLVGDIAEDEAVPLAAMTLGARPKRPAATMRAERPPLTYTAPAGAIEVAHEGPSDQAAARIYWARPPVRGAEAQGAAMALTGLLEQAVIDETRRRQGETYSPVASLDGALDGPDDIALFVEITPEARRLDAVTAAVLQAARRLAEAPPAHEALEQVRRPLLSEVEDLRRSNAYWADVLATRADWAADAGELDRLARVLGALTPEDVHNLARTWLTQSPIIVLARPAGTAGASR